MTESEDCLREPKLRLRKVSKTFGTLTAVDGVDLECHRGEVHAILGENGAGKSTLMRMVAGTSPVDSGDMWLDGEPFSPSTPNQAMRQGVGMVHQNFQLIGRLTVAENLFLGWDGAPRLASHAQLAGNAAEVIAEHDFGLDPFAQVRDLSVGEQQRVAILRGLVRGASLLILDEPTAALTPQEADGLFETMRRFAAGGRTVLFVTHKLREVMAVSTRVTVLRSGVRVATLAISECDERKLAREMLGRDVALPRRSQGTESTRSGGQAAALRVTCARVRDGRRATVIPELSLEIASHEIVGVAGISGNGQEELADAVTGVRPIESGRIEVGGADLTGQGAAAFSRSGVGYIPADRLAAGMMLRESLARNSIMKALHVDADRRVLTRGPWLRLRAAERFARRLLDDGQVSTRNPKAIVGNLSGGNIQRFLIARELRAATRALVAVHPTLGLDVGAIERTWQTLLDARESGIGILLISEDLDEILSLSDRVLVMYDGQIVGEFDNRQVQPSREQLGMLMGGSLASSVVPAAPDTARISGQA